MRKGVLVFAITLMCSVPVMAETYQWVDDRGTVNFTEDYGKIPEKYRKKVRVLGGAETAEPAVMEEEGGGEKEKKEPAAKAKEEPPAEKTGKKKAVYGGKGEDAWKDEFERLQKEINRLQDEIIERKAKLAQPEKLTRGQYRGAEYEIKSREAKLAELRDKLDALNEAARRAGVPPELRR